MGIRGREKGMPKRSLMNSFYIDNSLDMFTHQSSRYFYAENAFNSLGLLKKGRQNCKHIGYTEKESKM